MTTTIRIRKNDTSDNFFLLLSRFLFHCFLHFLFFMRNIYIEESREEAEKKGKWQEFTIAKTNKAKPSPPANPCHETRIEITTKIILINCNELINREKTLNTRRKPSDNDIRRDVVGRLLHFQFQQIKQKNELL